VPYGGEQFKVTVRVQVSPVFLSWCAMFGSRLKVAAPQNVKTELVAAIENTLSQYKTSEDE
jgi:predicted DNA-binding transcriptional regulator YafY